MNAIYIQICKRFDRGEIYRIGKYQSLKFPNTKQEGKDAKQPIKQSKQQDRRMVKREING